MAKKSAGNENREEIDIMVGSIPEKEVDVQEDKPKTVNKSVENGLEEIKILTTRRVLFGNKVLDLKAGQTLKVTKEFKKILIGAGDAIAL